LPNGYDRNRVRFVRILRRFMARERVANTTGTLRSLWLEISADSVDDLAAGLSYRFLLALFPFFIFLAALGGYVARILHIDNPSTEIVKRIAVAMPGDARSLLTTQLTEILSKQHAGLVSIAIIGALWAAVGSMSATMRAMNNAYGVEETRPFWKRTAIALGLTLLSGALLIAAFIVGVAGEALGAAIADVLHVEGAYAMAVTVLRYVLPLVLLTVAAAFLFWAAPNAHLPFRWISPGAVLFIVTWILTTAAFGLYVSHFGSYNATYGALGALIVLMLWFYLSAYMMLAGAELNALLARTEDVSVAHKPEPTDADLAQDRSRQYMQTRQR
jgi:membrane protein